MRQNSDVGAAPAILWFRRDLRLDDHEALLAAAARGPVLPVFILGPDLEDRPLGSATAWWLDKSLRALDEDLRRRGSRLIIRTGEAEPALSRLIDETGARFLAYSRVPDPVVSRRDQRLAGALRRDGVEVLSTGGFLISEPGALANASGAPFKVFSPFFRALRPRFEALTLPGPCPSRLPAPATWPDSVAIDVLGLHPRDPDWSGGFSEWEPGERGAKRRLQTFIAFGAGDYAEARDRPDREVTSRLSPHLRWGEIHPGRAALSLFEAGQGDAVSWPHVEKFLSELAWREFNWSLLSAFPHMAERNFRPAFDAFPWREDPVGLRAWSRGRTGYPLVDAGMRQMWVTGWMHNRVRMVAASFLIKHLLIDWRAGEAIFWDRLVDADLANNVGGWQWTAGSGADAAPYFRIFNPISQGQRFDPDGAYVRLWLPSLAGLAPSHVHAPWAAPPLERQAAGLTLGVDYPEPMVDHAAARARALAAHAAIVGG